MTPVCETCHAPYDLTYESGLEATCSCDFAEQFPNLNIEVPAATPFYLEDAK